MYNQSLLESKPDEILETRSKLAWGSPNEDALTKYPLSSSAFWSSNHTHDFLGTNNGQSPKYRRVNKYRVVLDGNSYLHNFAGAQRSIVSIEGFPLVISRNETYKDNENWFQSAMLKYITNGATKINITAKEPKVYNSSQLATYPYKSQSILTIKRALRFELDGTRFDNNYVVDDTLPHEYDDWHHKQSHGLLLIDFVGELILHGGAIFQNNRGMQSGIHMADKLALSYYQRGFKNRLIQFDRFKLSKFVIDGIKFKGNEAYNYTKTDFTYAFTELQKGQGLETSDEEDAFHEIIDKLLADQKVKASQPPSLPDPRPLLNMRPRLLSFKMSDFGN